MPSSLAYFNLVVVLAASTWVRFGLVTSQLDRLLAHEVALVTLVHLLAFNEFSYRLRFDCLDLENFVQILFLIWQGTKLGIFICFLLNFAVVRSFDAALNGLGLLSLLCFGRDLVE